MRAPNGDGAVFKISDTWRTAPDGSRVKVKRRKPWVFRITVGYERGPNGNWRQKTKTVGTYATYKEACDARAEYTRGKLSVKDDLTFAEGYQRWEEEKSKTVVPKTLEVYRVAYRKCAELYDRQVSSIRLEEMQSIIDRDKTTSGKKTLRTVFTGVFEYAHKNDYIDTNKTEYLKVQYGTVKSTRHYRFSDEELDVLWSHRDDDLGAFLIISCFTGLRTKELIDMKQSDVDVSRRTLFVPKGKTQNATRLIPVPDKIWPLVSERLDGDEYLIKFEGKRKDIVQTVNRQNYFHPKMREWGIDVYDHPTAGRQQHLAYDTRHTFQSLWGDLKLDNGMMEHVVGHATMGEGKRTYTHYDIEVLRAEMNKIVPDRFVY